MQDHYLEQRIHDILQQKINMGAGWAKGTKLTKKAKEEVRARKMANGVLRSENKKPIRGVPIKNPYVRTKKTKKTKSVPKALKTEKAKNNMKIWLDFRADYKKKHPKATREEVSVAYRKHVGKPPRKYKKKEKDIVKAAGLLLQDMIGSGRLY